MIHELFIYLDTVRHISKLINICWFYRLNVMQILFLHKDIIIHKIFYNGPSYMKVKHILGCSHVWSGNNVIVLCDRWNNWVSFELDQLLVKPLYCLCSHAIRVSTNELFFVCADVVVLGENIFKPRTRCK